ncbi:AAA family ATPase [Halobacterium sp. PCN9]|uniref:AAA family ATPase n=1 Tax=Halobacterium bonnevillei TaxID=2692200 RepID=A0A6B0SNL1_9EURY|nr:AAA family ATPase [Halobacterium bonnevillei]
MSDDAVQDLSEAWNVRDATLFRSPNEPGEHTRFGSAVGPDALRAALDRAARTVRETPPEQDGYAVPLHEPDRPAVTDEYVLWRPEAGQLGWFDTAFGIDGNVRFVHVADAAATTLGDRLRCWHPDSTPASVDPLAAFELPRTEVEAENPLSPDEREAFFEALHDFVDAERDAELAANRAKHRASDVADLARRGVATGPLVPLGRVSRPAEVGRFQFQLPVDDGDDGFRGGDGEAADLVADADVYPDSVFLVDVRDDAAAFPLTVRTTRVQGPTLTVKADVSCDLPPSRVESLLTDDDREFWFTHLLNPVPFDRRADAIEHVADHDDKRALLTGARPVRFAADKLSVPSVDLSLNEYQQRALKWADDAEDFLCIHGPPGTGKTRTLTAYVLHTAWHGDSVLVTAHSNQAVDNLLVGDSTLDEPDTGSLHAAATDGDLSIARVGHNSKNPVVQREYATASVAEADVVAATTSGAAQFDTDHFDVAVVDEATQASRPATAIVVDCAEKLVLSGDHRQLPPYAANEGDSDEAPHASLFEHLLDTYGEDVSVLLRRQYRMHEAIVAFPNEAFYDGRLETAARNRDWQIPDLGPLVGIDVAGGEQFDHGRNSFYNPREVDVVVDEVRRLAGAGVDPADVGVIAAYSAQVQRIRSRLADTDVEDVGRVTVDTVDSFQGGEREAVVVSFVRSNDAGRSGFLEFPDEGPRRLNVALTPRAKAPRPRRRLGDARCGLAGPLPRGELCRRLRVAGCRTRRGGPTPRRGLIQSTRINSVDAVLQGLVGVQPRYVPGDDVRESSPVFRRVAGVVRRDEDVLQVPERVVLGERFGVRDVQGGPPNRLPAERADERVRVDDAAARDVHEHALRREGRQRLAVDEAARGVRQRRREHQVVGASERVVDGLVVEPHDFVGRSALLGRVPDTDGVDAEPLEPLDDGVPDGAKADDCHGRTLQFERLKVAPLAVLLAPPALVEAPRERQEEPQYLFGDAGRVDASGVRHSDAAVPELLERQVAVSGVRTREQLEVLGLGEQVFVDAAARHDPGVADVLALLGGRSRERDLVVG